MHPLHWSIEAVILPLRYTWKISRNASTEKTNLIVKVSDGHATGTGEAAPNIRYGETPEAVHEQFKRFTSTAPETFHTEEELREHCENSGLAYALRFAIESAWMHMKADGNRNELLKRLQVSFRNGIPISYTIPIMDPAELERFYADQRLERFPLIKLKVDRDRAEDLTRELVSFCRQPVLLDANEAFTDVEDCIRFLERIKRLPLEIVEQPLPSAMVDEAVYLKRHCPFPLFADEAITHDPDFDRLQQAFDGINMKLMKAGGYRQGADILREARRRGMRTMIGCMVETSLGISSALHLASLADYADLDSFLLLQKEPFGLLLEENGSLRFTRPDKIQ